MTLLTIGQALAASLLMAASTPEAEPYDPVSVAPLNTGWNCSAANEALRAKDQKLLEALLSELPGQGFKAVQARAPALRKALQNAPKTRIPAIELCGSNAFTHTPGQAMSLAAALFLANEKNGKGSGEVFFKPMPYATLNFLLGSLAVEMGQNEEAIAILEQGSAFAPGDVGIGNELAGAYSELGRFADSLAVCDRVLAWGGENEPPLFAARIHRRRGYALAELARYDEAIAAYKTSLTLDPTDQVAPNELAYIASRQAGGAATPTVMTTSDKTHPPGTTP